MCVPPNSGPVSNIVFQLKFVETYKNKEVKSVTVCFIDSKKAHLETISILGLIVE